MKKVFILGLLILTLISLSAHAEINEGLVAYYPFNGNANDESGNGNNGTVNGATLTSDRFGNADSAYIFDGVDDYISVSNSSSLQSPTTKASVTTWVYVNNWYSGWVLICAKSDNSAKGQYALAFKSSGLFHINLQDQLAMIYTNYKFELHTWYFVTFSWDGNEIKIYVNGIIIDSQSFSPSVSVDDYPLEIGRHTPGGTEYMNGKLDEVRIYNRALSEDEIEELYDGYDATTTTTVPEDTTTTTTVTGSSTTTVPADVTDLGDVNGDGNITSVDASMTMQIVKGRFSPTHDQLTAADADRDEEVTSEDAEIILRWASEKCKVVSRQTIGPEGGILELNNLSIIVSPNAFTKGETITIKEIDVYPIPYETLEPLGSFYKLENFPAFQGPITIQLSFDPNTVSSENPIFIYLEEEAYATSLGGYMQSGRPLLDTEVDKKSGKAGIQIPQTLATTKRNNMNNHAQSNDDSILYGSPFSWGHEIVLGVCQSLWGTPKYSDDRYFVIFPAKDNVEFVPNYLSLVNQHLTDSRKMLEDLGFSFLNRTRWPIEVYYNPDFTDARAFRPPTGPNFAYIKLGNLHPELHLKPILGHELFHLVQWLYDAYSIYYDYLWLNEACSVWFEPIIKGDKDYVSRTFVINKNFIWDPLEKDDADHGYGASAFITYLTEECGNKLLPLTYERVKAQSDNINIGMRSATYALAEAITLCEGCSYLGSSFQKFAFKYFTTEDGIDYKKRWTISSEEDMFSEQLHIPALSAWNYMLEVTTDLPDDNTSLMVSLEGNTTPDLYPITGAVFTSNDEIGGSWQQAGTFSTLVPFEIKNFGENTPNFVYIIVVNSNDIFPYDQVTPTTLTISLKEEEETTTLPYGQNLLVNPGAEEGPYYDHETNENCKKIEHWSGASEGGYGCVREYDWYLQKTADDDRMELGENFPPPDGGKYAFSCWNNSYCNTSYTQRVDVSMFDKDIDAGRVTAEVSLWWGGMAGLWIYSEPEFTCSLIPERVVGPKGEDLDKKTSMKYYEKKIQVPTGTRFIDIKAHFETSFACIDNMSLKLHK